MASPDTFQNLSETQHIARLLADLMPESVEGGKPPERQSNDEPVVWDFPAPQANGHANGHAANGRSANGNGNGHRPKADPAPEPMLPAEPAAAAEALREFQPVIPRQSVKPRAPATVPAVEVPAAVVPAATPAAAKADDDMNWPFAPAAPEPAPEPEPEQEPEPETVSFAAAAFPRPERPGTAAPAETPAEVVFPRASAFAPSSKLPGPAPAPAPATVPAAERVELPGMRRLGDMLRGVNWANAPREKPSRKSNRPAATPVAETALAEAAPPEAVPLPGMQRLGSFLGGVNWRNEARAAKPAATRPAAKPAAKPLTVDMLESFNW